MQKVWGRWRVWGLVLVLGKSWLSVLSWEKGTVRLSRLRCVLNRAVRITGERYSHGKGRFLKDVVTSYGIVRGGISCSGSPLEKICQRWRGADRERMDIKGNSVQESVQNVAMK